MIIIFLYIKINYIMDKNSKDLDNYIKTKKFNESG